MFTGFGQLGFRTCLALCTIIRVARSLTHGGHKWHGRNVSFVRASGIRVNFLVRGRCGPSPRWIIDEFAGVIRVARSLTWTGPVNGYSRRKQGQRRCCRQCEGVPLELHLVFPPGCFEVPLNHSRAVPLIWIDPWGTPRPFNYAIAVLIDGIATFISTGIHTVVEHRSSGIRPWNAIIEGATVWTWHVRGFSWCIVCWRRQRRCRFHRRRGRCSRTAAGGRRSTRRVARSLTDSNTPRTAYTRSGCVCGMTHSGGENSPQLAASRKAHEDSAMQSLLGVGAKHHDNHFATVDEVRWTAGTIRVQTHPNLGKLGRRTKAEERKQRLIQTATWPMHLTSRTHERNAPPIGRSASRTSTEARHLSYQALPDLRYTCARPGKQRTVSPPGGPRPRPQIGRAHV